MANDIQLVVGGVTCCSCERHVTVSIQHRPDDGSGWGWRNDCLLCAPGEIGVAHVEAACAAHREWALEQMAAAA